MSILRVNNIEVRTGSAITFSNNVDISGSFDAAGIVTARSGIDVTGGDINIGTGTSISSPSSNTLTLGTNNEERLRITSDGKFGLGTTSASEKLTIVDSSASPGIAIGRSPFSTYGNLLIHGSENAISSNTDTSGNSTVSVGAAKVIFSNGDIRFSISGSTTAGSPRTFSESARFDSSGRMLVGTPSSSRNVGLVVQGNSLGANQQGVISIASDKSTFSNGENFGLLSFTDNTHDRTASIEAVCDGTFTAGSSRPARLVFSTTADGDPSPTERMRIRSNGVVRQYAYGEWMRSDGTSGAGYIGRGDLVIAGGANSDFALSTAGGDLVFGSGGTTERMRIDSSGRLLVGTSSARSNFFNTASSAPQQLQVEGTTGNNCSLASICSVTDTSGGRLLLAHQRSGGVGGNTILDSGDQAGYITFQGNDGGEFVECASIEAIIDGTPGADDMPGALVFSTTVGGASSPTERMRIDNNGGLDVSAVGNGDTHFRNTTAQTTVLGANMYIDATSGVLRRSTSSIKYKTNVETLQDSYADAVLNCRPVWYQSTSNYDNHEWGYWGFIAEEVAAIDPRLCLFGTNEDGTLEPEGVQYDRFVPHLLNLIKRQGESIAELQAEVAALKAA